MSDLKFNCPYCGQPLVIDAAAASEIIPCPHCEKMLNPARCSHSPGHPEPESHSDAVREAKKLHASGESCFQRAITLCVIAVVLLVFLLIFIAYANISAAGVVLAASAIGILLLLAGMLTFWGHLLHIRASLLHLEK